MLKAYSELEKHTCVSRESDRYILLMFMLTSIPKLCALHNNVVFASLTLLLLLQAVINSTVTPNMTFTKTSQKFGQWSDVRANTVYGLGFASEPELNKVRRERLNDTLLVV
jgi:hypothetical protein